MATARNHKCWGLIDGYKMISNIIYLFILIAFKNFPIFTPNKKNPIFSLLLKSHTRINVSFAEDEKHFCRSPKYVININKVHSD